MVSNYTVPDPIFGTKDLDDVFITDAWLVDQFVGSNLLTCGYNTHGSLGYNNIVSYSSPVQIGSLTNWKQVAVQGPPATTTSIGVKIDGTLWSFGSNAKGQLGNNVSPTIVTAYSSPVQVGSLTNWKQVACGYQFMAAVKTDGSLWTWGYNNDGQLGNSALTTVTYSSPIQVGALTNWKQVACGYNAVAATKTDGSLWTWGNGNLGQIGNGAMASYSSPIQLGALTNWKQISCGYEAVAAIKTDGSLWTWGVNTYGGLGINISPTIVVAYSSPVQVGALTNWKYVSMGKYSVSAIKTDGTLWTWGINNHGQIGNNVASGTVASYSSPVQVGSLTNWKSVTTVLYSVSAVKTDGTAWAWGYNINGQLGNGTITSASSPVQVGTLTNWKQVACGYDFLGVTYTEIN